MSNKKISQNSSFSVKFMGWLETLSLDMQWKWKLLFSFQEEEEKKSRKTECHPVTVFLQRP